MSVRGLLLGASRVSLLFLGACGSRTQFEFLPGPPECVQDSDCAALGDLCFPVGCRNEICQDLPPISCDDANPCTTDSCDPSNGACMHPPSTLDLDQDGHRAPLSGKAPGEPSSCGDDCDDTNARAFPGGVEICDGLDNDCNGVVDDGAQFSPVGDAVKVSEATQAHPQSLGYSGGAGYMSVFSAEIESRAAIYLQALSKSGELTSSEVKFTPGPADAYGGPLVWTGDRYGIAWSDRRDARGTTLNYEVYFNLVNPDGTKRNADLRVTREEGFSINVSMAWTGNEFVLVWEDDGMTFRGENLLFAQRIDVNGAPIGGNVRLIDDGGIGQTGPVIATGLRSLGVVWMRGDAQNHELMFAPFDSELKPLAKPVSLTGMMAPGVHPTIVHNQSEYMIAWYDPDSPKKTVYGAVRGELGEEIVTSRIITQGNNHARLPSILPYGDRALLIWADDRDNNRGYELYAKMLGRKLEALTPEQRITNAGASSGNRVSGTLDPSTSFGPNGEVGVLFGDDRTGLQQVYFTHLNCVGSMAP